MYYTVRNGRMTPNVCVFGPLYTTRGQHMYAVGGTANEIENECKKACAKILNIGGHIINEERQPLKDGYVKVTFTYVID